jgi:hypothetical protein
LHEFFVRQGHQVEVHPQLGDSSTRPDFILLSPSGSPVACIEAVRVGGLSDAELKAQARIGAAYDALDGVVSPDYFISVEMDGEPLSSIPDGKLRKFVERNLQQLDRAVVAEQWRRGLPFVDRWEFEHDGCTLFLVPMPKKPEFRGDTSVRPLGVMSTGVVTITPADDIHAAIARKATRYGTMDVPFIIALNTAAMGADRDAVTEALFGTNEYVLDKDGQGVSQRRVPNGVWIGRNGPIRTNVSGVLAFHYSLPSQIGSADVFWIPNPWATLPLTPPAEVSAVEFDNHLETGRFVEGESAAVIFGIAPDFREESQP